jgi:hypothetical protein
MNTDLLDRLSDYRSTLDEAIVADAEQRAPSGTPPGERGRRALVGVAAASAVVIGLGTLVWASTRSSDTSPAEQRPFDEIVATSVAPAPSTTPVHAPPTSPPASPTTAAAVAGSGVPVAAIPRLAIGDSVMLGAAAALGELGYTVDAREARTLSDVVSILEELRRADRLGEVVGVGAGTDDYLAERDLDALMTAVEDVPTVLMITVAVDRPWAVVNNDLIRALPERFANVTVVDWAERAAECSDDCFYDDGIHLRATGQAFYAALIAGAGTRRADP